VSRPLSDFPKVLASMGSAASRLDVETVAPMTLAVASAVRLRGGRYGIKGRNGAKVRLGARSNVRGFGDRVKVGNVKGDPAGFWRIVTDGSGKHLIVGRHKRGGGRQTVAGARRRFANVGEHEPGQVGCDRLPAVRRPSGAPRVREPVG
jgi:hypothetical protein